MVHLSEVERILALETQIEAHKARIQGWEKIIAKLSPSVPTLYRVDTYGYHGTDEGIVFVSTSRRACVEFIYDKAWYLEEGSVILPENAVKEDADYLVGRLHPLTQMTFAYRKAYDWLVLNG